VYKEDDVVEEHSKALGNAEARFLTTLASRDKTIFTTDEARPQIHSSAVS
jgi:hypothetical protein